METIENNIKDVLQHFINSDVDVDKCLKIILEIIKKCKK